jgi:hypothetical protein
MSSKKMKKLLMEVKLARGDADLENAIFNNDFNDEEIIKLCYHFMDELDWDRISSDMYKSYKIMCEFKNELNHNIIMNDQDNTNTSKDFMRIARYNSNLYGKDTDKRPLPLFHPKSIDKLKEIREEEIIIVNRNLKGKKNYNETVTLYKTNDEGEKEEMTLTLEEIETVRNEIYTL